MIVGYRSGTGFLYRAHPFTLLTLVVSTAVLAFALPAPLGASVLTLILAILAVMGGGAAVLPTALLLVTPFWAFLFVIHVVLLHTAETALRVGSQVSAMLVAFLLMLAVTNPSRMIDALLARGTSPGIAYLVASSLIVIPRLKARAERIIAAQRCRGLRLHGAPWRRVRAMVPLVVPLVITALQEAELRSQFLALRGAGSGMPATPLHPPPDRTAERWLRAALMVAAIGVVVWRLGPGM